MSHGCDTCNRTFGHRAKAKCARLDCPGRRKNARRAGEHEAEAVSDGVAFTGDEPIMQCPCGCQSFNCVQMPTGIAILVCVRCDVFMRNYVVNAITDPNEWLRTPS